MVIGLYGGLLGGAVYGGVLATKEAVRDDDIPGVAVPFMTAVGTAIGGVGGGVTGLIGGFILGGGAFLPYLGLGYWWYERHGKNLKWSQNSRYDALEQRCVTLEQRHSELKENCKVLERRLNNM